MAIIKRILIHHHASIYTDPQTGERYTYSFIGRWVNELTKHFDTVGLLFHEVPGKSSRHDTLLNAEKIVIETLGNPGRAYDRFQKMARVKAACKKASNKYDALLIRGITPRQYSVFKNVRVRMKSFLLVGSIHESKPKLILGMTGLYMFIMYFIRKNELRKISKSAKMMANSPKVNEEILRTFGVQSEYIPTNTIQLSEMRPLRHKEMGSTVRLFFCGRIVLDKGVFELIEAVHLLNAEGLNCMLTLTGIISTDLKSSIEALPYWSQIKGKVNFTGFVKFGEELLDLYDSHDIYVLPSYHEGFPHSIWEAAAVSSPVITTAVGGISGVLSDKDVWFIPVKDVNAIVKTIKNVMNLPEERKRKVESLYELLKLNTVEAAAQILKSKLQAD